MRFPSHMHTRVSRAVALRAALGTVLGALVLVPAAGAAPGDRGVFASKGVGRVVFVGGAGPRAVFYGTVFSGGSLVVTDYSATQDMKVESPVVPTTNVDGSRTYSPPAGSNKGLGFRISGSVYRLTVTGSSSLSAFGVYGRVLLRGKGTLSVDGVKNRWNGPQIRLKRIPKAVRAEWDVAFANGPVPVPPAPPEPPPVTTAGTSPADTVRTDGS